MPLAAHHLKPIERAEIKPETKKVEEKKEEKKATLSEELQQIYNTILFRNKQLYEKMGLSGLGGYSVRPSTAFYFMLQELDTSKLIKTVSGKEKINAYVKELKEDLKKKPPIIKTLWDVIIKSFIPGQKGYAARQRIAEFFQKPFDVIFESLYEKNRLILYFKALREKRAVDKNEPIVKEKLVTLSENYKKKLENILSKAGMNEKDFLNLLVLFEKAVLNKETENREEIMKIAITKMEKIFPKLIEEYKNFLSKREKIMHEYVDPILIKAGYNVKARGYHV